MKVALEKKYYFIIGGLVFLMGVLFLLFSESGILKFMKLKKELNEVQTEIKQVETENRNLIKEIDSVKNKVPAKIEKVSREKHSMIRKNEKVIEVIEK